MLRRALIAAAAMIVLAAAPALARGHGSHHSGGSHGHGHTSSSHHSSSHGSSPKGHHPSSHSTSAAHHSDRCTNCDRDGHGRILRSGKAKDAFKKATGYPHGRSGYVIDHITPLACGGQDVPSNMQWQTAGEAKQKDKVERKGCSSGSR